MPVLGTYSSQDLSLVILSRESSVKTSQEVTLAVTLPSSTRIRVAQDVGLVLVSNSQFYDVSQPVIGVIS